MTKDSPVSHHPFCSGEYRRGGFTMRRSSLEYRASVRGGAIVAVLMFVLAGTIVITAFVHLMSARVRQSEGLGIAVQRHVTWGNTKAINQQYAFTWAMRDTITRLPSSATLAGWGGVDADPFTALKAFETTARPSTVTTENSYPFNNIANTPTADNGVFFARTTADSDVSQTEHLAFYNYLKTYPSSLLGDLLVIHKRPSGATGTYAIGDNIQVNGRVVIWDSTANTSNIRAQSCLNMTKTGTNTTKNTGSSPTARLPQNFNAKVSAIAGYGGTSTPTAVTNGTLNLANNTDFTPSSIRHIMEGTGLIGLTWVTCASGLGILTNVSTTLPNGSSTSDTQLKLEDSPPYPLPPTSAPYFYNISGDANVFYVRLKNSSLRHLHITSGVEQLVLEGQTTTTDYTNAGNLPPVIIWVDQPTSCRDIRFVGENNRRLILVTGRGTTGTSIYCSWHGNSLVGGSSLRWRLHWINEYRSLYLNAPTGLGVLITGGVRTDWSLNFTDSTSAIRFTLQRETDPGNLLNFLPRDGWLEPYAFVR